MRLSRYRVTEEINFSSLDPLLTFDIAPYAIFQCFKLLSTTDRICYHHFLKLVTSEYATNHPPSR